jgi:ankyrin repeat protein
MIVKVCKTCATDNLPSNIECIKCLGDISGVGPVDKDKADAEKAKSDFLYDLRNLATNVNEDGLTALMAAVHRNDPPELLAALIAAGADVNAKDTEGRTPLLIAIIRKNDKAIKTLIDAGVDLESPLRDGKTPLMVAASNNNFEAIIALIKAGADINAKDENCMTSLMATVYNNNLEAIAVFLDAGVDINAKDKDGRTALSCAVWENNLDAVAALLSAGSDVSAKYNDGKTPLILAVMKQNVEIVAALLKNGRVALKDLYSEKTGKTYSAVVELDDTGDGFINFKMEFQKISKV